RSVGSAEPIDFRTGIAERDNIAYGKQWPDRRCIRAKVLAALLLDDRRDPEGRVPVLRLTGARITGHLELSGAEISKTLWLDECYFDEAPDLADSRTRTLRINRSSLPGLNATNARIDGQLSLNSTIVSGRLKLVLAHITGELTLNGTQLVNPDGWTLFAGGVTVDGGFFGRNGFESQGMLRLVGARLNGGMFLDGAR